MNGALKGGALMVLMLVAIACNGPEEPTGERAPPLPVTVAEVQMHPLPPRLRVAGIVRPGQRATLSTRMSGEISALHVSAGDAVAQGEVLVVVEARDVAAAVEAAERQRDVAAAALDQARTDAQRLQRLYDQDLIALARLEQARLLERERAGALARAEAEWRAQLVNLDYAQVRAPFSGTVSDVPVDLGSFVGPGVPLLVLEQRSRLEVDASVDQALAAALSPGERLAVIVPGLGVEALGRLQAVIPALQNAAAGSRIRVLIDEPPVGLRPGQVVDVL
ncbi:MAG: efflux RND transporter periplasmic adaptor subunit, partial [Pseudomonadales bacterium]